jgi:hypothetical protein
MGVDAFYDWHPALTERSSSFVRFSGPLSKTSPCRSNELPGKIHLFPQRHRRSEVVATDLVLLSRAKVIKDPIHSRTRITSFTYQDHPGFANIGPAVHRAPSQTHDLIVTAEQIGGPHRHPSPRFHVRAKCAERGRLALTLWSEHWGDSRAQES